jgi:hypothetical protein
VTLPKATNIGDGAFDVCTKLTTLNLPEATTIGNFAFSNCTVLFTVDLPAATSIGTDAFLNCYALTTVTLPEATSIGDYAFESCTALTKVSLPKAASIGQSAFSGTGAQALTVTLGSTVPTLGIDMFSNITDAKTVTVKVPSGALGDSPLGYGPLPTGAWGHDLVVNMRSWYVGFRGKGWDGTQCRNQDTVNDYISLTIKEDTA